MAEASEQGSARRRGALLRLAPFLRPYRGRAIVSLLILFAMVGTDLLIPRLTQRIIDQGRP